ncbi:RSVR protein, partial [Syrrhaptes paradoxus]|nr:RSVR protein [Syrrhaptes paradoxus]
PGRFRCDPDTDCYPEDWRCDGHADCKDEGDERDCGTATPAEPSADRAWLTPSWSSALLPPARAGTGRGEPGTDVRTRCSEWSSACALFSLVLLSILVAVGSVAVWGLSTAKSRPDIFSLEKASKEQLIPDKSV